jgi:hypothetical protein
MRRVAKATPKKVEAARAEGNDPLARVDHEATPSRQSVAPATKLPARAVPGGQRLSPPRRRPRRVRTSKTWVGAALAILAVGGLVGAIAATGGSNPERNAGSHRGPEGIPVPAGHQLAGIRTSQYGQPIDGIQCQGS